MTTEQIIEARDAGLAAIPVEDAASAKAAGLFTGWTRAIRPVLETHDVLEVEREFSFPFLNPETEGESRSFVEAGKIDAIIRHKLTGIVKVLEHKTTADSVAPESNYWARLAMDSQITKYILGARHLGYGEVNTVLYDVIRKPSYKLSNIPVLDEIGLKIVRDAAGIRVTTSDGKKWRQTGDTAQGWAVESRLETPAELSYRVADEVQSAPAEYFAQHEVGRTDSQLLEYMEDAWAQGQMILYFRKRNLWPRNPSACSQFGNCEFFDLCSNRASVDGVNYAPVQTGHAELNLRDGDRQLLTNSRLTALRKCSRYHYHRYEQPIRKIQEADEPLELGSKFHKAAEIFLSHFVVSK
jgi:hypothetical protein